jgi:hemolysin activation/secretion protein
MNKNNTTTTMSTTTATTTTTITSSALPAIKPLLALVLLAFQPLVAHAAEVVLPNAGSILKQIPAPAAATPAAKSNGLSIEQAERAALPVSPAFLVQSLQVSGNTAFDTASLHALVADAQGQQLTLQQLDALAARITAHYQNHGYPLARAIIPAQTISNGVVQIRVIEASYGKVSLANRSRVNDPLLTATLAPLQSGQAISQSTLDRSLLLLADIPGLLVNATLMPGDAVGTSDLLVNANSVPAMLGNAVLDNDGSRYTGRVRLGATLNFIHPLHQGDLLTVSALTSGKNMNYGRIAYDTLLDGAGTRIGGAYSDLTYKLGDTLQALNAHGNAQVASVWIKRPVQRSVSSNFALQLQYDRLQLRDHIDVSAIRNARHLDHWNLNLSGDQRNAWAADSILSWTLGWSAGRVSFDDATARAIDAATLGTQGGYSKLSLSLNHLQNLGQNLSLSLAASGQWANANLDSSQKMSIGGAYTVRAYDMGVVSGDMGYLLNAELRRNMGSVLGGQWQALGFIDSAHVTINQQQSAAQKAVSNEVRLSGAGIGASWAGSNQWAAKLTLAAPLGSTPAVVGHNNSARLWAEISKAF